MPQNPHWLQWDAPHLPKIAHFVGQLPIPSTFFILGPSQPTTTNGIQIQPAVLPQYMQLTDRQIDRLKTWDWQQVCTKSHLHLL